MYIRCADCQATTWIQDLQASTAPVGCQSCGRRYDLSRIGELGSTGRDQYRAALVLAERESIDLPSAYSVLLGIMTMPQARAVRQRSPAAVVAAVAAADGGGAATAVARSPLGSGAGGTDIDRPSPARRPREGLFATTGELAYDPGFRDAVREGLLTATQAMERGDREALAERLARLHGLSLKRAYLVADNRLSIGQARRDERSERLRAHGERPARGGRLAAALAVAVFGLAATGLFAWNRWIALTATPVPPAPVAGGTSTKTGDAPTGSSRADAVAANVRDGSDVLTDEQGRVVSVSGPNPSSVLIAYCNRQDAGGKLEPLELTSTVPVYAGARLGLFRDLDHFEGPLAIRIRRDRATGRWVAGDGRSPLAAVPAPTLPEEAQRFPIR